MSYSNQMKAEYRMNPVLSTILLVIISLASILPAFPILGVLQNNFPDLPSFYTIDKVAFYFVKAAFIFLLGMISMCIYSDFACPLAIKGYAFVFSRM